MLGAEPLSGIQASGNALTAHGLTKRYRRRGPLALRDVNLAIPAGSITGLVGPNGAGKSTLLRTWMGFERPTSGVVTVLGADPLTDRAATISRLAYLAQSPALYRDLTVTDHLAFAAHYRPRFDRARAIRRLAELDVPPDVPVGTLSGGQAAQVGLALALGLRAEILLLDEPLASLDPLARREFLEVLLAEVHETGATVMLSSHLVSDIEAACNRLIVLGVGRTMLDDAIERIRAHHAIVAGRPPAGTTLIAGLPGMGERSVVRVENGAAGGSVLYPAAGLEDVVMAYLAAARG